MAQGRERLERILAHDPDVTIYGVTTGPGQLAGKTLTPEQRERWAARSPARIATSWGDPLPDRVVRAIVLARLANFVEGHAAVSPEIARRVAAMLDRDEMPSVPAVGQGGAGEILSLSHLFMGLAEEARPAIKDVMCLVNGSPAATGLVTDAALVAAGRLDVAARVFALSFEAFDAPLGHLDPALAAYWNNPHDGWALDRLRALVAGGHGGERRPYQAPVSYRILPRMLGQARRAAALAAEVAAESLQAVTDNPVWVDDADEDHPFGRFVTSGGYHNPHAVLAMDAAGCGVGQSLRPRRTPRREATGRRGLVAAPPVERRSRPATMLPAPISDVCQWPRPATRRRPASTPRPRCSPAANPAASGRMTWRARSSWPGPSRSAPAAASTWRLPAWCRSRFAPLMSRSAPCLSRWPRSRPWPG